MTDPATVEKVARAIVRANSVFVGDPSKSALAALAAH